jgi:hypothetical protein
MGILNLQNFDSLIPRVRYSESKKAIQLSIQSPEQIYPYFDFFKDLLENSNTIFKWTGILVIGNLSKVDKDNRIDKIIPQLIKLATDQRMITANNTIKTLGLIAQSKPQYAKDILNTYLAIEHTDFYIKEKISPECRNVALAEVLTSLPNLGTEILKSKKVQEFIKRQLNNPRPSVRKLAEKLLI